MSKSLTTTEGHRIVIHPGDVLSETLAEAGLSANAAALAMAIPANRLTAIINKKRSVTAETAMRLGRLFGTSAKLWMNLQARYDLQLAEAELRERISSEVRPFEEVGVGGSSTVVKPEKSPPLIYLDKKGAVNSGMV